MSLPLPQTYTHPTPLKTLAPFLLPHLPHSLPLLRRIQFHIASPTALALATFPPSTSTSPPSSFSALWIDRTRAPETECWLFSTYELPSSPQTPHSAALARSQLLSLLSATATRPPPNPRRPNDHLITLGTLNERLLPLLAGSDLHHLTPTKVLSRTIEDAAQAHQPPSNNSEHDKGTQGILSGLSVPYMKWIIAPPSPPPSPAPEHRNDEEPDLPLPPSYTYSRVRASRGECRLPILRSDIPRTERTLAQLGSVGIRYLAGASALPNASLDADAAAEQPSARADDEGVGEGELVAWAFLGVDGSLTSLHVEAEHRGQGLAKAVSGRLFRLLGDDAVGVGFRAVEWLATLGEGVGVGMVEDEAWAHSDVTVDNLGSAGVARALGGRDGWLVRWVSVDLGRVREVVEGLETGMEGGGGALSRGVTKRSRGLGEPVVYVVDEIDG